MTLQDRLAARANSPGASSNQQAAASAHVDVAARYGHPLRSLARVDGSQWLCPAEEPARLLRGHLAASGAQRVQAALQLTRSRLHRGRHPAIELPALHARRAQWLDGIALQALTPQQRNRLLLRRAGVQASLAFANRDSPDAGRASPEAHAARRGAGRMDAIDPRRADRGRRAGRARAALRIAPMRWLARPAPSSLPSLRRRHAHAASRRPGRDLPDRPGPRRQDGAPAPLQPRPHPHRQRAPQPRRPQPDAAVQTARWLDRTPWRVAADGSVQVLPPPHRSARPRRGRSWPASGRPDPGGPRGRGRRQGAAPFEVYRADIDVAPQRWSGEAGLLGVDLPARQRCSLEGARPPAR